MMNRTRTKTVSTARDRLVAERAKLSQWQERERAARAALEELQGRIGESVLEDPAAAEQVLRDQQSLRDQIFVAEQAQAAQTPRVAAAESAYLVAEADILDADLAQAEAKLAQHQERTAELLRLLEDHEGIYVPENLPQELAPAAVAAPVRLPKSAQLMAAIEHLERQIFVLREIAAGREPDAAWMAIEWHADALDAFPACVFGPEAVVASKAYLREVESTAARVADLEEAERDIAEQVRARATALDEKLVATPAPGLLPASIEEQHRVAQANALEAKRLDVLRERLGQIKVDLEAARRASKRLGRSSGSPAARSSSVAVS